MPNLVVTGTMGPVNMSGTYVPVGYTCEERTETIYEKDMSNAIWYMNGAGWIITRGSACGSPEYAWLLGTPLGAPTGEYAASNIGVTGPTTGSCIVDWAAPPSVTLTDPLTLEIQIFQPTVTTFLSTLDLGIQLFMPSYGSRRIPMPLFRSKAIWP